ncbi:MAG: phosphatidylglycerophosphatase A [Chitinispirillaceae bacterium]|nr:phosphatidylglycerophosphatase A [Chitinispirillaceae bacterium]
MAKQTGNRSLFYWIRKTGASLFFLGFIPAAPGTIGSAVTVAGIWYLHRHEQYSALFNAQQPLIWWACSIGLVLMSLVLSSHAKETFGRDDPGPVIIDEVAGQFITFFMVPLSLRTLIAGFFLFRFFDIVKPFPVNDMQQLDDNVGITMDDVLAGVYANCSLLLTLAAYRWIRGYL